MKLNKSRNIVLLSVVMVLGVWATSELRIHANSTRIGGIGPDVIVGDIPNISQWGSDGVATSFSIGTTSCNVGDEVLSWIASSPDHPVISQNLYRVSVENGRSRIEQLGQSWLKHGYFALQGNLCGSCNAHPNGTALGVGCSDPYGSNTNGQQLPFGNGTGGLGPRSEVNASTGVFAWPPRRLTQTQQGLFGGRIRVLNSDLDPAQNPGALYFIESQYVHPDDAAAGNGNNNNSYRQVNVTGSPSNPNLGFVSGSPTVRREPAINAWQTVHSDVQLYDVVIPGDGLVVVGVRTTQDGNGFHTEIAIENLTSDQSVRALRVVSCGGAITSPGFKDVDYHAEDYSGDDWLPAIIGNEIEWSTATFDDNEVANALRWGTLYSYWFDSDSHPSELTLGLFKPGALSEVTVKLETPEILLGDVNRDGAINLLDVQPFVAVLSGGGFQCEADINGDGVVNLLDVDLFVLLLSGG